MDLLRVIYERRSVRKFKSDPIPDEIITEILEAARRAPSWANSQASRFIVVKDPDIKQALSDTLATVNPARGAVVNAPLVMCLYGKKGVSGFFKGQPATDKGDWLMFDAGIAMEHIVLAAWSFGLGSVHVGAFDAPAAQAILKIPEEFSLVEMVPVGYFDEAPGPTKRRPLGESVCLDVYGRPYAGLIEREPG